MTVQFVLGDSPHEKRKVLIDQMYEHLNNDKNARILYLIPDNVKYEAETMILEQFKEKDPTDGRQSGMIRLQVFSFSRLAWYLLQNKPIYQRPQLTDSGLAMLVKRILQEETENLTIFRGTSQETGFIERLVALFSELRNGKVTPTDLKDVLTQSDTETNTDFQRKIDDLTLLYQKYDENLKGKYIEQEDLLLELINYIKEQKENFKNVTIIVDHYEHFSAQEQELLVTLANFSKLLLICLTINEEVVFQPNNLNNLFYRPLKTYYRLKEELSQQNIEILDDLTLDIKEKTSKDIKRLKSYWQESSQPMTTGQLEKYQHSSYPNLEICAAEDSATEVMHIATKIKRMIASGKYRYRDFQIMTRDLESYELNLEAIFHGNEIPYFIDQAETMAEHPLLEFIESLFALESRHFRLNDIFRFLRTELFVPNLTLKDSKAEANEDIEETISRYQETARIWRNKVDIAENVALAYGYQGNDWTSDEEWIYARFELEDELNLSDGEEEIQAIANEVRQIFKESVVPFINQLEKIKTNKEAARVLYRFMLEIGVIDQLEYWREQLNEAGNLEEARKHEQAWETFVELLDELVEVLGDKEWDLDLFVTLIESGFEQATYSMVPPTIDQVLITNYDLPKIQTQKVVFLIGLNDTVLPLIQSNQSLLTDEDRELVEASLPTDKYLAVSEVESAANEPFAFYLAFLQASEEVIFSYPLSDGDNSEHRISPYLSRLQRALSLDIHLKYANACTDGKADLEDYIDFIGSKMQSFGQLILSLREAIDKRQTPNSFWLELFQRLYRPNNWVERRILRSLSHKNIPVPLTEELAEELYGKDLYLSVSQLETFYADPFSHFLLYGLRLRERQIQELSPLESGNFYHDALDLISRQALAMKKDLAEITRSELKQMTTDIFQMLMDSNKYRLAQSSYRMNFIFKQLAKTVENLVWSMVKQAKRSKFRTSKTELVFGHLGDNQAIPGLSLPLNNDRKLYLRGKVDRIDTFTENDRLYAGIVDYKSSDTAFNYQSIYYGLMLQMITYLDTVLTFSEDIFNEPASGIGAFYSTVKNPFIDLQALGNKEIDQELLKQYKLDGLIVDQREVLEAADKLLEPTEHSPIYNLYLRKNDTYSNNKILTKEEFDLLMKFNREKIIEAGNKILKGENLLRPIDKRRLYVHTPSIDGPYKAISQFDALLPENNYQEIEKMNKKDFFAHLKKKYKTENNDEEAED